MRKDGCLFGTKQILIEVWIARDSTPFSRGVLIHSQWTKGGPNIADLKENGRVRKVGEQAFASVRCWSLFVDLAAFGLFVPRDSSKRLNPKRTAMTVFGNSRELVSDLSLYSLVDAGCYDRTLTEECRGTGVQAHRKRSRGIAE
jgi:hypothetical protein